MRDLASLRRPFARWQRGVGDPIRNSRVVRLLASPFVHAPLVAALLVVVTLGLGISSYHQFLLELVLIYMIAALGLNVPTGLVGQLSLGQGAAFGLGAYVVAISAVDHGWTMPASIALSLAMGAVLGLVMGLPAARLGLIALAMVSLGVTLFLYDAVTALTSVTGGPSGIVGVSALATSESLPLSAEALFLVILVGATLVYIGHWRLRVSNFGRGCLAIRDEIRLGDHGGVAALGINRYAYIVAAFVIASALGALAGALYAYVVGVVAPDAFDLDLSILILLMVIVGGAGSRIGPVLGAGLLGTLPILLQGYPQVSVYIYGAIMIAVVRLRPSGIISRTAARVPRRTLRGVWGSARGVDRSQAADAGEQAGRAELDGVTKRFGGVVALEELSLVVEPGSVVAIVGPNGSGKTTALNMLSGYYRPDAGKVTISGQAVKGLPAHVRARRGVGRTFQVPKVFLALSLEEHIALAERHRASSGQRVGDIGRSFLERTVFQAHRPTEEARRLAHGHRRFLEVGMALCREPDILLMDEPAAGLSASEMDVLATLIRDTAERGVPVIVVEHHLDWVKAVCDRVAVMESGRLLWTGDPNDIDDNAAVRAAYLGTSAVV